MKLKILNDFVFVRKCIKGNIEDEDGKIILHRTDRDNDTTNFAEIIDMGNKCKVFSEKDIGKMVLCPEFSKGMHRIKETEDFLIREEVLLPATFESKE